MPTPEALTRRIALVRRRVRAAVVAYGAAWLVAVVAGLTLLAACGDRAFHFDNPALRAGLLAGIAVIGGFAAWRLLIAPLVAPISDTALAMRIERRFPGFEERLASSLQFVEKGGDASLGSPDLQQRVIAETIDRSQGFDFGEVVRFAVALPPFVAATGILVVAALLFVRAPKDVAFAMQRLFSPYSAPAWPRQTNLRLSTVDFRPIDVPGDSPLKVARGRKLELLVEDQNGRLPDDVSLEYRLPDEPPLREALRHASLRDRAGVMRDVCLLSLPAERGPVWFRALGGDDDTMPEFEMLVVLPPVLEQIKVTLTPPKYTGRPVEIRPNGDGRIRGVLGTQVAFAARSTKPLASADVTVKGKRIGKTSVLADGRSIQGLFVLADPGTYPYTFGLKDSEKFENLDPPRYEIEALADSVPDVAIDEPATDMTVTSNAQIPVTVSAKDDLGLRDLRLRFNVGESDDAHATTLPLAADLPRPQNHRVSLEWRLHDLSVSEGMRIVFHAEATDWFDLGPAHVGKSLPRTLTVISAPQKEAEIVARQADLLRLLERAEQSQSRAHEQTGDLAVQVDKVGRLKPSDLDVLKRVQSDQRQINNILANPADGAATVVRRLLDELKQNRITSSQTQERLERFNRELSELREAHLATADNQIARTLKSAELQRTTADHDAEREQSKSLKAAKQEQGVVLESLRNMLGALAQWRDWQGIHEGLHDLAEGQEKLNRDTADVSRNTLAKPFSDLGKQEQADLARLAERQTQLAEQVERLKNRLRAAAKELQSSNKEGAAAAAGTLKSIEHSEPDARMREIGGQLARNNVGQAMQRQQQLLDELRKLDQNLSQRPEQDLESLVNKMSGAEQKIDALRKDQEGLRKQTRELGERRDPKPDVTELERLRKEQGRLRDGAEEAARELRRLGTETSSERMRDAGAHMSRAEEDLEKRPSGATDAEQQQAIDELDRAQKSLNRAKKEASQQLARQSLVRIGDELAGLAARQKTVLEETKRLNAARAQANRWTRGQLRSLQSAARQEVQLHDEAGQIGKRLKNSEVYAWALRGGAEKMQAAASRLEGQVTDAKTVALETDAWTRLRDLVQSLKQPPSSGSQKQDGNSSEGDDANGGDGVPQIAQLVLLKTLQQDLLRQTSDVDRRRSDAAPGGELAAELNRLAAEQGELVDLIERMARKAGEAAGPAQPKAGPKERSRE